MSSSGTITQANEVLDYLKANGYTKGGGFIKTGPLLVRSGLSSELDHKEFRAMLLRLHSCGVLAKFGQGSFEWRLAENEWNRDNPFYKSRAVGNYAPTKPIEPATQNFKKDAPIDNSFQIAALQAMGKGLLEAQTKIQELESKLTATSASLQKTKDELEQVKTTANGRVKVIEIKRYDNKVIKLKDKVLPKMFDRVLALAKCRRNILLVGPAGCGKTYMGKLVADVLGLDFGSLSCTAGISESHLLGKSVPNLMKGRNIFQGAGFLDCFEKGGVYLLDEFDAADSNLVLCLNTGLANGYLNVPNRRKSPRAIRHPEFICIATANTFGRGANRQYAGRNQLDEATLDRFRIGIVEMDYDQAVEMAICPDIGGNGNSWITPAVTNGQVSIDKLVNLGYNLRETCQYIRHKIAQSGMRRIMSSRFMEDAYIMMKEGGWELKTVLEAFLEGWTPEEVAKVS